MLTIDRPLAATAGDGVSRRRFLGVGSLAFGALTLGDVLRLRADSSTAAARPKSVIMIFLSGGPSHLDMYDMKPEAPSEYRGEFSPIATNVPGIEICELMPMQAKIADKFAILRGVQLGEPAHRQRVLQRLSLAGVAARLGPRRGQRPALGSVVSRLRGGERRPCRPMSA